MALSLSYITPAHALTCAAHGSGVRRSGVLPISIATDGVNFSCAFDCAFCPNETVAAGAPRDMARSYLSSEVRPYSSAEIAS